MCIYLFLNWFAKSTSKCKYIRKKLDFWLTRNFVIFLIPTLYISRHPAVYKRPEVLCQHFVSDIISNICLFYYLTYYSYN